MESTSASWPEPSIELFDAWLDAHHIQRHPSLSMVPMSHESAGFCVTARAPIPLGSAIVKLTTQTLCAVPKSTIFSHRTASLDLSTCPSLAGEPEAPSDIFYRLAACLLHELRLGEESSWYGWLQVLPRETVPVPILWNLKEVGGDDGRKAFPWLKGTDAEREMKRQNEEDGLTRAGLRDFFWTLTALPPTTSHPSPPTYSEFLHAFSLISSRGFMLDSYHQIGIPPYCDMFNHSSSSAHTSLLCDVGVCSECGSLQPCQHDELDSNGRPERLEGIEPAYLARMAERGEGEQVDMRAERDISAGVEVFSCYEEGLTSAKALVGYGFAPSEPTRSRISWGPWDILDKSSAGRFIHIMKRGVITAELFGDDKEEDWEFSKPLFRPGGSAALGSFDLSMDGDGTLSIDLLTAIHARTFHKWRRGLDNFNDQDDAVIRDAKALQAVADAQLGLAGLKRLGDETGTLRPLIRAMVQLLEDRLGAAHRPELSPEEIEKEILGLPASSSLQRQAISFALDERVLLQKVIGAWAGLLSHLG